MVDIHNCTERLERVKKRLFKFEGSELLLNFMDHPKAKTY
jgi:hypothetical protein